jgi:hypothetical protein
MISISITPEDFEAIRATFAAQRRAAIKGPNGLTQIWLDPKVADELGRARGPGGELQRRHPEAGEGESIGGRLPPAT